MKGNNGVMCTPKEKRGREGQRAYKEVIAESFPILAKEPDIQIHEAKKTTFTSMQKKRPSLRHTILKLSQLKTNIIINGKKKKKNESYPSKIKNKTRMPNLIQHSTGSHGQRN